MITFTNCKVFDGTYNELKNVNVTVEGERISTVSDAPAAPGSETIDCGGRVLMPGMIDAHVHVYALSLNVTEAQGFPNTLTPHHARAMMGDALERGFTTLRDTGGADWGLWLAIEQGLITAPRLYYCGRGISQTGGHLDMRHQHHFHPHDDDVVSCGCCFANGLGWVVDGVPQVRKAVREELRRGASFIKFAGSGGVSTTADDLNGIQLAEEEVLAIVEEVENHNVYCTAHIHPDRALKRAVQLGVHCIEHGTLIEEDTAKMAAEAGTKIVPTLAVMVALSEQGRAMGYPPESMAKLDMVKDSAVDRLNYMRDAGVHVGFGTDLIGAELQKMQCIEFGIRAEVFSNFEILHQATGANAEVLNAKGDIGEIAEGCYADILLVDGNPLEDISVLAADGANLPVIMKGGEFHRNNLN
ncbi:MAG: amidohydrolase family protein [Pseudomonadales bacterium]|jgi:imidazolonepropionase-like amidohydrolase|nr:amidohydrolase family protein [Kiritimatiellia bacterium]MDP6970400.1 amidohydrolase family protein [Pseudomonadales bacterium]